MCRLLPPCAIQVRLHQLIFNTLSYNVCAWQKFPEILRPKLQTFLTRSILDTSENSNTKIDIVNFCPTFGSLNDTTLSFCETERHFPENYLSHNLLYKTANLNKYCSVALFSLSNYQNILHLQHLEPCWHSDNFILSGNGLQYKCMPLSSIYFLQPISSPV